MNEGTKTVEVSNRSAQPIQAIVLANAQIDLRERYQKLRNVFGHCDVSRESEFFTYQFGEPGKFSSDVFLEYAFETRHDHAVIYRAQQISTGYDYGYDFELSFSSRFEVFDYCGDSNVGSGNQHRSHFSQVDGHCNFRGIGQFFAGDRIQNLQASNSSASIAPFFFERSPTIDEPHPTLVSPFSLFEDLVHQYSYLPYSENTFAWPRLQIFTCGDLRGTAARDFSGKCGVTSQVSSSAQNWSRSFAGNILKLLKSALRIISAQLRLRFYHFNIGPLSFEIVVTERDWFKTHGPRPPRRLLKRLVRCFQQINGRVHSPLAV